MCHMHQSIIDDVIIVALMWSKPFYVQTKIGIK